jgi:hypothetical protein
MQLQQTRHLSLVYESNSTSHSDAGSATNLTELLYPSTACGRLYKADKAKNTKTTLLNVNFKNIGTKCKYP